MPAKARQLLGLELVVDVLVYRPHVRGIEVGGAGARDGRVCVVKAIGGFLRGPAGAAGSISDREVRSVDVARLREVVVVLLLCLRRVCRGQPPVKGCKGCERTEMDNGSPFSAWRGRASWSLRGSGS